MLALIQNHLPELSPLIIGAIAFVFGIGFALRERAWRRTQKAQGNRGSWDEKAAATH